jgi:hypothetical protein
MMRIVAALPLLALSIGLQAQTDPVAALVGKSTEYVERYEARLAAVVCEERQRQIVVNSAGVTQKERELVSDLLLVKVSKKTQIFRDVIRVDGKPVRDRQERLRKLFLSGGRDAVRQAQAISHESDRYNIGFRRGIETLLIPLAILHADQASGFHFVPASGGLAFEEFRSPSMIRHVDDNGPHDMLLRGTLDVAADGAISGASLLAEHPTFRLAMTIKYALDPGTELLVPTESHERYQTPKSKDQLDVYATYSNFRQFQVKTEEEIATPK